MGIVFFIAEGDDMRIADFLSDETKKQLNQNRTRRKKRKRNKKKLTQKELEELMGVNRDIYVRKNGAIRRK